MNPRCPQRRATIRSSAWSISSPIEPIQNCEPPKGPIIAVLASFHFYRRLAAGHTAVHIACRLGNVPILHMLLSIKKETRDDDDDETSQQQRDDKHLFDCLRMKDHSNLTPVHWAATQESVSKRQKMFAYLDRRMPGVLDSRYNLDWFTSWARIHSWVLERKATKYSRFSLYLHFTRFSFVLSSLPIRPVLRTSDRVYGDDESADIESLDMTPRFSNNDYERTPRAPLTATTAVDQYNNTFQETPHQPSKLRTPRVQVCLTRRRC